MNREELGKILDKHKLWLNGKGGERAYLSGADLSCANLSGANLSGAYLSYADLSDADLSYADLSGAYLSGANLSGANLSGAYLSCANLSCADLSYADLSGAYLSGADLSCANLSGANLSGAKNLLSSINFLEAHFEKTSDGYIVYKTFNSQYNAPKDWIIKKGSIITETVNPDRCRDCGSGINVAPKEWVKSNYPNELAWKCLIRWEWLAGVIVPYMTDGKIRCEKVELVEVEDE